MSKKITSMFLVLPLSTHTYLSLETAGTSNHTTLTTSDDRGHKACLIWSMVILTDSDTRLLQELRNVHAPKLHVSLVLMTIK